MEYRRLGRAGIKVSALSFGSWVTFQNQLDEERAYACMKAAKDAGVNFFDNAEAYADGAAEILMGKVIKRAKWPRKDLVVSTKIFWGGAGPNDKGLSRKHLIEGTKASLERLELDYVDLLYCHRPDPETPVEETVRAMTHLVNQGKAFYWGTSEWSREELLEAYAAAKAHHLIPPAMEQPEYNMFARNRVEKEYHPLYEQFGLGTTVWSPLASGLLTGKYGDGIPADSRGSVPGYEWLRDQFTSEEGRRKIEKVKKLLPLAKELQCSMAQFALAWCLKNPHVSSVITGASRPEQVQENMKALDVARLLTPKVMSRVDAILQ